VTRDLIAKKINKKDSFEWLGQLRFYFEPNAIEVEKNLKIKIANGIFNYGFEYLGIQDKLVQTPLTDRCFLTMSQALDAKFGGSPFGPAGTGKTESIKCFGNQLGKFVLTFNCDETFDFQSMGRIFVGLCQVGAWGCFDEFNRLEECMLSAVSQQIQTIQEALKNMKASNKKNEIIKVEIVGKEIQINPDMAIFITMNPGYAGRSNLPDNLKKLFRSLAMTQPNKVLIAQVMLYSQGFRSAEILANKIVPLFSLCSEQLSNQSHYDFGLRSLKSVLIMAGNLKREQIMKTNKLNEISKIGEKEEEEEEKYILIKSVMESFVPRLVAMDLPLLSSLLNDVFPNANYIRGDMDKLKEAIKNVCEENNLIINDDATQTTGGLWLEKVLQLYQIINLNHGLMLVGPTGSGKTQAWQVLLEALNRIENSNGVSYVIDPKAMSKDELYGFMDPNTREWNDGLFTGLLRRIIDNVRGELTKRQWIIFDGDVDPEWVENLNSVLDDNKLLTLPNGERLGLPPNIRIIFEVQDLKYATAATVSRCGMIWFSDSVVTDTMLYQTYLKKLNSIPLNNNSNILKVQQKVANIFEMYLREDGLVGNALNFSMKQEHIMDFLRARCLLASLFPMLNQISRTIFEYNESRDDNNQYLNDETTFQKFVLKSLIIAVVWSFSGDSKLKFRNDLADFIQK
jgi:dynein heavy chain 1, cytosolic